MRKYISTILLFQPHVGRGNDDLSKSLFNVRHQVSGGGSGSEVPPPSNPDLPLGRVKRLLKSNSLAAIADINWGWRKETAV
jgi:hypothetical protein